MNNQMYDAIFNSWTGQYRDMGLPIRNQAHLIIQMLLVNLFHFDSQGKDS